MFYYAACLQGGKVNLFLSLHLHNKSITNCTSIVIKRIPDTMPEDNQIIVWFESRIPYTFESKIDLDLK